MNILYIDHYAGSVSMGMEFRPYYLAREWQKMGHRVRVMAADYSHLRNHQPEVPTDTEISQIDGVEFQIIKAGTYEGNGAKRALSMFRFVAGLWRRAGWIAKEFMPEVIISSSTYPLDSYAAARIALKSKGRYIHEAHDVWPLTLVELGGMSPKHPFVQLLDRAERYAYRHCDRVVSILPDALPHMMEQGLQEESKFAFIPNGVVIDEWEHTASLEKEHALLLDALRKEGRFIVMYLGGHAMSNALDQLLDAAKIADGVTFVLIGKGVEKARLEKRAKDENLTNVVFLPPIQKEQVPDALRRADALYIGAEHSSLYRFGVSMNKMYDYMMSGKPILNGVVASNNDVEAAGCGLSFDSSRPEEIADAVNRIRAMSVEKRTNMGCRGAAWVRENCDYRKLAVRFLDLIAR